MSGKDLWGWSKLSEAKLAEIESLYEMGMYDQQVADYVGCSVDAVKNWRHAHGKEANRTRFSAKRTAEPPPAPEETPKKAAKAAPPPAPVETVHQKWKRMRKPCRTCGFWNEMFWCCDYLFVTGRRRPCPPGRRCTVRK